MLNKIKFSPNLLHLDLRTAIDISGENEIGDEGVKHLKNFTSLKILMLNNCGMSDVGMVNLSKIRFPKLESVTLSGNKIGMEGRDTLTKWRQKQKGLKI